MSTAPASDPTPAWDAAQYLHFAEERTRPCRELAARVAVTAPRHVIDLGCGPGNSTQVMAGPEAIVEWYRGTGLRPYLAALVNAADREQFLSAYLEAIRGAYPPRPDGRVLFPFRRLFLIAYSA